MGLYFLDDINSYTLAQPPPSPWNTQLFNGNSQIDVEADPAAGAPGGRVIRLFDLDTTAAANNSTNTWVYRTGIPSVNSPPTTFDLRVRAAGGNGSLSDLYVGGWGSGVGYQFMHAFKFRSNDMRIVNAWDPGAHGTFYPAFTDVFDYSYTADTWYSFRWTFDFAFHGVKNLYINGVLVMSGQTTGLGELTQAVGIAVKVGSVNGGSAGSTWFIDDARAAASTVTRTGIVRAPNGLRMAGATVAAMRQSDNTILATTTTDVAGNWTITVPAPDPTAVLFAAYAGLTVR